ncbi:hypothetical protein HDU67_009950 [Dinochytrium kinnereticum]|nr:hypothetical protein HDU67_009950 [Dinochytrium kinnereticum]
MNTADSLKKLLEDRSFRFKFHDHPSSASAKEWVETVKANPPAGITDFSLTKTLVLKAKGADAVPILVIALEDSEFGIGALGKHLGAKEARAAADDLVTGLFKVPRLDVSPFALVNVEDKASISVVVDSRLFAKPTTHLCFRAFSATQSVFVSAANVRSFISGEGFEIKSVDFANLTVPAAAPAAAKSAKSAAASKPKTGGAAAAEEGSSKEVKIGIEVKKSEDFPLWYQQVLTRTEMMDYYDVSGCYIIRPWAFKIWKEIQNFFGKEIEDLGVEDCYFPMFVSRRALEREKDHIEGFAPEVAWVTKAGETDLAEPVAVRPTSETVMYPAYAKWVQSHRDLPIRLNQWCNVVRWEFKNPQPFLRTREFLWQEGHTAFATKAEADVEVRQILDLYRRVYEELLAVPVVPGVKSENEKFAGGLYTTTVEGFVPTTGRGIQGATSHCLGQNFAKMFKILIENDAGEKQFIWQNSWGLSTRTLGVVVMVHGDDKGLVLPPKVAAIQAVVVPTGITAKTTQEEREKINKYAEDLVQTLKAAGIRSKGDFRDNYTPGYKFNHWEMRGVPIRLEVGPKDIAKNETRAVFRLAGNATQISLKDVGKTINELLVKIQKEMFDKAKAERDQHLIRLESWDGFVKALDGKNIILAPWCERVQCEKDVKERSGRIAEGDNPVDEKAPSMGAKTLCIPFEQPKENPLKPGVTKCFACDHKAVSYTLWGRSY